MVCIVFTLVILLVSNKPYAIWTWGKRKQKLEIKTQRKKRERREESKELCEREGVGNNKGMQLVYVAVVAYSYYNK